MGYSFRPFKVQKKGQKAREAVRNITTRSREEGVGIERDPRETDCRRQRGWPWRGNVTICNVRDAPNDVRERARGGGLRQQHHPRSHAQHTRTHAYVQYRETKGIGESNATMRGVQIENHATCLKTACYSPLICVRLSNWPRSPTKIARHQIPIPKRCGGLSSPTTHIDPLRSLIDPRPIRQWAEQR